MILKANSSETLFWSVNFLKILNFLLLFISYNLILLMIDPTLLILYAIMIQLKVSMKIRQSASWWLAAEISPKPTVNIILVAQYNDQIYFYIQAALWIPLFISQLSFGLRFAIEPKKMPIIWAKQKLTKNTFASYQYCSLYTFLMKYTYNFYILSRHWGNLKMMNILKKAIIEL